MLNYIEVRLYKHVVNMLFFSMNCKGPQIVGILSWFLLNQCLNSSFFAYGWECYSKFISLLILNS